MRTRLLADEVTEGKKQIRKQVVLALSLTLAAGAVWGSRAQQPAPAADDPRFTGKSETLEAAYRGAGSKPERDPPGTATIGVSSSSSRRAGPGSRNEGRR